ncbi:hypothetical protein HDZ31DRAFT_80120 [Schizophyllum fasciatum]
MSSEIGRRGTGCSTIIRVLQPRHGTTCSTSRYRSINEFIPHAHWLMADPTMNTANCMCKYCQRTPQRQITQVMTQANVLPSRAGGYGGKAKVARLRSMAQKPAAATRLHVSVQRPLKPLRPSTGVDRTPMNQDRNHDLRVLHASAHRQFKRWFRDGEVIAGEHALFWTPTDEWEFRYHPPPVQHHRTNSRDRERSGSTPGSLPAALNAAAAHNERVASALSAPSSPARSPDVAGTDPDMTEEDLKEVSSRLLGDERPGKSQIQIRYQGLWWGPERIWVDDVVRLKVPRSALAVNGAPHIYEPAPPSAHVVELSRQAGYSFTPDQLGAKARATFMRLSALAVVEYERNGRRKKECRAIGELYELADEGYEEPEPALRNPQGPQTPEQSQPAAAGPSRAEEPNAGAKPAPGDVLSGPLWNDRFPLPPPPDGYLWRRITHPGFEAVMSLTMISGRYYPGILHHPLLATDIDRAVAEGQGRSPLFELEGLTAEHTCFLDAYKFKQVREQQLVAADRIAREVLCTMTDEEGDEPMEVDEQQDVQMETDA